MSAEANTGQNINVDVVIIGGGIAGAWTLARLRKQGYNAILLEADALGAGQTRYAQGIIHGGTKYALTGKLTASSEAVANMPSLWYQCYQGKGELDLREARLNSDAHYLWSTTNLTSKIAGFFASKMMRTRVTSLNAVERPGFFQHKAFKGHIYRLDEPVFDTLSVMRALVRPLHASVMMINKNSICLDDHIIEVKSQSDKTYRIEFSKLVLMAGQGNADLLSAEHLSTPQMQKRPLKMVMVRGDLQHKVFAHCMGAGVNPRVTITSHEDSHGNIVWYLGGQLAENGANHSDDEQIKYVQQEMADLMPWQSFQQCQWAVLDIDRAEVMFKDGHRPDSFYADMQGDIITAWPTKLALAPLLASHVLELIAGTEKSDSFLPEWPEPKFAEYPWCEEARWN